MNGSLDWIADTLLTASADSPSRLSFLLKHYLHTGRLDVRDALEIGLSTSLRHSDRQSDACVGMRWTALFSDASTLADDGWMAEHVRERLPEAVDALEGFVRRVYEPGDGLIGIDPRGHAECMLALLDAFDLTGRLPYPMLADELYRTTTAGWFGAGAPASSVAPRTLCMVAFAGCRLAALHRTPDYLARAVVSPGADYAPDVDALLAPLATTYRSHPAAAADYGLALIERLALTSHPN